MTVEEGTLISARVAAESDVGTVSDRLLHHYLRQALDHIDAIEAAVEWMGDKGSAAFLWFGNPSQGGCWVVRVGVTQKAEGGETVAVALLAAHQASKEDR